MGPFLEHCVQRFAQVYKNPVVGYWCAALMIAPAAAVVALYPMNWILGADRFYMTTINVEVLRPYFSIPLVAGAMIAYFNKNWVMAVMLVPGLLFIVSTPNEIGGVSNSQKSDLSFYPTSHDLEVIKRRIVRLDEGLASGGWIVSPTPPNVLLSDVQTRWENTMLRPVEIWLDARKAEDSILLINDIIKFELGNIERAANCVVINRPRECQGYAKSIPVIKKRVAWLESRFRELSNELGAGRMYSLVLAAASVDETDFDLLRHRMIANKTYGDSMLYIMSASVVFLLLIWVAGFLNSTFYLFVVATAVVSYFSTKSSEVGTQQIDVVVALYPAFIAVVSGFVLRFAFRAITDNQAIFKMFPKQKIISAAYLSIIKWLPFPLVVAGVLYVSGSMYSALSDKIYEKGQVANIYFEIYKSDPWRDTLHEDVKAGVLRKLKSIEAKVLAHASEAKGGVQETVLATQAKIKEMFATVLPEHIYELYPDLEPPEIGSCFWFFGVSAPCIAKSIAYKRVDAAYRGPRNRLKSALEERLSSMGHKVVVGVSTAADEIKLIVVEEFKIAEKYAINAVNWTFLAMSVMSVLQMAFMLLVCMRGYLLIFGRILYSTQGVPIAVQDKNPYLTLAHGIPQSPSSTLTIHPHQYPVDGKYLPLIAKRSYGADNALQSTLVIKSFTTKWLIRRCWKCLLLCDVTHMVGQDPVCYTSGAGRSFVVWTIPPHSKVFFDFKQFVGMSNSLKLKREISLRVGGLTFGTTMHAYVESGNQEGVLIQESSGSIELRDKQSNPPVGAAFRFMSWRDDTAFKIASPTGWLSLYIDTPSLDPEPGSWVAYDTDGGRKYGLGVLTELVLLLRP